MEPKECNSITCALVVVAKDEDKFLGEWINYYKNLGINKIFLGDNNLPENPLKINDPKVEVIPFNSLDFIKTGYYNSQCFVYDTILNKIWDKFDYCLICDVDEFIEFALSNKEYTFLVTRIGCGIAGFNVSEMAAIDLENVILPDDFVAVIER